MGTHYHVKNESFLQYNRDQPRIYVDGCHQAGLCSSCPGLSHARSSFQTLSINYLIFLLQFLFVENPLSSVQKRAPYRFCTVLSTEKGSALYKKRFNQFIYFRENLSLLFRLSGRSFKLGVGAWGCNYLLKMIT